MKQADALLCDSCRRAPAQALEGDVAWCSECLAAWLSEGTGGDVRMCDRCRRRPTHWNLQRHAIYWCSACLAEHVERCADCRAVAIADFCTPRRRSE